MRVISVLFLSAGMLLSAASTKTEQGITDFNAGRYSVALPLLKQAVQEEHDPAAAPFLALTQAAMGDCDAAGPELNAPAADLDPKLKLLVGLAGAKCDMEHGRNARAYAALEALNRSFPNDPDVLYLTAKLHMQEFNDVAYAMFQHTPQSYRVHQLSAEIFETENRFSDAAEEYRKAIALNPTAASLHFQLGRAMLLESHSPQALEKAAQEFENELRISPEDAAAEFELGQIARAQGKAAEAQTHFERAAALSPTFVEPMVALGKMYCTQKQYGQAISFLTRATKLEPDNESAHYTLMTAYRDSGDMEKAKQESALLQRLQKPPEGEFTDFLKRLGENQPQK